MNTFNQDLERGKIGEDAIEKAMIKRGLTVERVTSDSNYFESDIDFIMNGRTVELKTDYRIGKTGNLFLEKDIYYCKDKSSKEGWFNTCKADILFYLDIANNILYIYKLDELRDYVKDNYCNTAKCNDGYKVVTGYLVKATAPHCITLEI